MKRNVEIIVKRRSGVTVKRIAIWIALALGVGACGNRNATTQERDANARDVGEQVTPPFRVAGEARGLLLQWADAKGMHTAENRSQIPAEHRRMVRVDSLDLPPEKRLDPEFIYVADLRKPNQAGTYSVRKIRRQDFERQVQRQVKVAEVILYKTSWCGVCRTAANFLRERRVSFVEKDIEKDISAQQELSSKLAERGLAPRGVPVLDIGGQLLQGFQPQQVAQMLETAGSNDG